MDTYCQTKLKGKKTCPNIAHGDFKRCEVCRHKESENRKRNRKEKRVRQQKEKEKDALILAEAKAKMNAEAEAKESQEPALKMAKRIPIRKVEYRISLPEANDIRERLMELLVARILHARAKAVLVWANDLRQSLVDANEFDAVNTSFFKEGEFLNYPNYRAPPGEPTKLQYTKRLSPQQRALASHWGAVRQAQKHITIYKKVAEPDFVPEGTEAALLEEAMQVVALESKKSVENAKAQVELQFEERIAVTEIRARMAASKTGGDYRKEKEYINAENDKSLALQVAAKKAEVEIATKNTEVIQRLQEEATYNVQVMRMWRQRRYASDNYMVDQAIERMMPNMSLFAGSQLRKAEVAAYVLRYWRYDSLNRVGAVFRNWRGSMMSLPRFDDVLSRKIPRSMAIPVATLKPNDTMRSLCMDKCLRMDSIFPPVIKKAKAEEIGVKMTWTQ